MSIICGLSRDFQNKTRGVFYKYPTPTNRSRIFSRRHVDLGMISSRIIGISRIDNIYKGRKALSSISKNNIVYPISKIEYNDKIYRKRIRPLSFRRNKNIVVK